MPIRDGGAQRASLGSPIAGPITWLRSPRPWVAALALALLMPIAPSALTGPQAVAAAGCGTWQSRVTPPPSIRVLRTATGIVEEVHFATYVATVMASGEWPTHLPKAALEAGATATKQYAWYYTLRGSHRAAYRTRDGQCYDVRDDTMDQLYRPEGARPTQKQLDALAATWALSLRKNGRFFLTGYRAGADVGCARDADGWRLYATSVTRCAKQGWSRARIQERYYAPKLGLVWDYAEPVEAAPADTARSADRRAPLVLAPRLTLNRGARLSDRIGTVRWAGADAGTGLDGFEVQQRIEGGPWTPVTDRAAWARALDVAVDPTVRYEFRVRARDDAGNLSTWAPSSRVSASIIQSTRAYHSRGWAIAEDTDASSGSVQRATATGAAVSLVFHGRALAIVAPTGPGYGTVRIRVKGETVATVNLGRLPKGDQRIIWSGSWHGVRKHRVGVVVARSGGRPVDLDAFVVVR